MRIGLTATAAAIVAAVAVSLGGVAISLSLDWTGTATDAAIVASTLSAAVVVAFAIVGAVIAGARPTNWVGRIMLLGATFWAVGSAGADLAVRGLVTAPGSVPGVAAWAIVGSALRGAGWYLVVIGVAMVFPDGHLVSPRWRWLPRLLAVGIACTVLGVITASDANLTDLGSWRNPIALPQSLQFLSGLLSFAGVAAGLVATVGAAAQLRARWRSGAPLLRQQLILLGAAVTLTIVAAPISLATNAGWVFSAAALPLPFIIGFAVLARGLYDLKTAANRTLVWTTLSLIVAGIYALIIASLSSVLHVSNTTWLAWVAAAVVALSFAPLRDALQRSVNRLTYGRWDEPYAVLAALGQRLEASTDTDRLLADAVTELRALGLDDVSIRDAQQQIVAGTTTPAGSTEVKLLAYGREVGTLSFHSPVGSLRRRDHQLIADLAGQLGGVLQTRELVADLQRALERLVLAREEERRRLRRDLHDGLGPSLAGHTLQLDVIASKLGNHVPVGDDIAQLRDQLRSTVLEVRRIVEGLRPPALDELGLTGALQQVLQRLSAGSHTAVELAVSPLPALPAAVEVAAFRVTTEAVTNAIRHAHASSCVVRIDAAGNLLRVRIRDDGTGLWATPAGGHGLQTMRERVEELRGRFCVESDGGTVVSALLPLSIATPLEPLESPGVAT